MRSWTLLSVRLLVMTAMVTVLAGSRALAQYTPTDNGSEVRFAIRNLGFRVTGSFSGLQGSIRFDPGHGTEGAFDISVDATTVSTDNSMRDDHLRAADYFDVQHYPRIRFVSTRVTASNKRDSWIVFGKLTIKNHTKDISFPFSVNSLNGGYLFKASFPLNRRDFEVGGASIISDELDVTLNILTK
ncbi:MAG TPA: YceI family protein [Puia sp.]|jgi:polyisoprenoid-binding protein YceI|nr:YceI family protein [Puia sp.]